MTKLVQFQQLKGQANTQNVSGQAKEQAVPPMITKLRHRLVSGECADSLDTKMAIVGELVYLTYVELMKRRYL